MKKLQITLLLTVLLINCFNRSFAQQETQTVYQKKIVEISQKYFKVLYGYNKQLSVYDKMQLNMLTNGEEASRFILGIGMLSYASNHSEAETKRLIEQIKSELKQAEKLKTAVDFKREKDAKEKKERDEKEKKFKEQQEAYERTDAGRLKKSIKEDFEKWNQKGEFEKEVDYLERLKKQSQSAFEEICIKQVKYNIDDKSYKYNLKKELSIYDSESEYFTISFKFNGLEWQNKINIPISQAQNFKTEWTKFNFEIDEYDWRFVDKNLCPSVITVENTESNSKYKLSSTLNDQYDISCSFDSLGIDNSYLRGYIFNYSNVKAILEQLEKEKQRLDSLELVTYNQKLDIIFQDYNKQLMQNPYNTSKIVLTSFNKIGIDLIPSQYETLENIRERKFNELKDDIEREFRVLNNNFEEKLKISNPSEYCKVYFSQNPEKKSEADKKYLECKCNYPKKEDFYFKYITGNLYNCNCRAIEFSKNGNLFASKEDFDSFYDKGDEIYFLECEKRTSLNYLNINSSLLQSMNFQKDKNEILSFINENQSKPFYLQIIDLVIETNNGLFKEWGKNGSFFKDKLEFYNAYISGNYRQILREKKHN